MAPEEKTASPKRGEFLLQMYSEMWGNIDRHIVLSWQPFAVLLALGALFNFALGENAIFAVWMASSLALVILSWFVMHIYDANGWFWRNHLIIANLEEEHSLKGDQGRINPFMGDTMPVDKFKRLFSTLRPHFFLGFSLAIAVLLATLFFETLPAIGYSEWPEFRNNEVPALAFVPYLVALVGFMEIWDFRRERVGQYELAFAKVEYWRQNGKPMDRKDEAAMKRSKSWYSKFKALLRFEKPKRR